MGNPALKTSTMKLIHDQSIITCIAARAAALIKWWHTQRKRERIIAESISMVNQTLTGIEAREKAFEKGVSSVRLIRCLKHRDVPQQNSTVLDGGSECGICTVNGRDDLLYAAWGIIANAGGGDWDRETFEWIEAARKWRDKYHAIQKHE